MINFNRYKYYTNGRQVIAVSTFAGKTVRGVATCDPNDTFDLEKGKKLAAARCNLKVASKRVNRAVRKLDEADAAITRAEQYADRMENYFNEACIEKAVAEKNLNRLMQHM